MNVKITHEENYPKEEKIKWWGEGEWVNEPDIIFAEYRNYSLQILRIAKQEPYTKELHIFGGHLCGYVLIPSDHPYLHKRYEEMEIDCHGGLTFGEVAKGHWIGFDCAHSTDYVPSTEKLKKEFRLDKLIPEGYKKHPMFNPTYKTVEYVISECKGIINQLIEIKR